MEAREAVIKVCKSLKELENQTSSFQEVSCEVETRLRSSQSSTKSLSILLELTEAWWQQLQLLKDEYKTQVDGIIRHKFQEDRAHNTPNIEGIPWQKQSSALRTGESFDVLRYFYKKKQLDSREFDDLDRRFESLQNTLKKIQKRAENFSGVKKVPGYQDENQVLRIKRGAARREAGRACAGRLERCRCPPAAAPAPAALATLLRRAAAAAAAAAGGPGASPSSSSDEEGEDAAAAAAAGAPAQKAAAARGSPWEGEGGEEEGVSLAALTAAAGKDPAALGAARDALEAEGGGGGAREGGGGGGGGAAWRDEEVGIGLLGYKGKQLEDQGDFEAALEEYRRDADRCAEEWAAARRRRRRAAGAKGAPGGDGGGGGKEEEEEEGEERGAAEDRAVAERNLGRCLALLGRHDQALARLKKSLELASRFGLPAEQERAYMELGNAWLERGERQEGGDAGEGAAAGAEGREGGAAAAGPSSEEEEELLGNARRCFREALRLGARLAAAEEGKGGASLAAAAQGRAELNLGLVEVRAGNGEGALAHLGRAAAFLTRRAEASAAGARDAENETLLARARAERGRLLLLRRGREEEGCAELRRAAASYAAAGASSYDRGLVLADLARHRSSSAAAAAAEEETGAGEEARACWQEAANIFQENGFLDELAQVKQEAAQAGHPILTFSGEEAKSLGNSTNTTAESDSASQQRHQQPPPVRVSKMSRSSQFRYRQQRMKQRCQLQRPCSKKRPHTNTIQPFSQKKQVLQKTPSNVVKSKRPSCWAEALSSLATTKNQTLNRPKETGKWCGITFDEAQPTVTAQIQRPWFLRPGQDDLMFTFRRGSCPEEEVYSSLCKTYIEKCQNAQCLPSGALIETLEKTAQRIQHNSEDSSSGASIDLSMGCYLDNGGYRLFLECIAGMKSLAHLNVSNNVLSVDHLRLITRSCFWKQIRSLRMSNCSISGYNLSECIVISEPAALQLELLDISWNPLSKRPAGCTTHFSVDFSWLEAMLVHSPKLRHLDVSGCTPHPSSLNDLNSLVAALVSGLNTKWTQNHSVHDCLVLSDLFLPLDHYGAILAALEQCPPVHFDISRSMAVDVFSPISSNTNEQLARSLQSIARMMEKGLRELLIQDHSFLTQQKDLDRQEDQQNMLQPIFSALKSPFCTLKSMYASSFAVHLKNMFNQLKESASQNEEEAPEVSGGLYYQGLQMQ